jgi:Tol biopolymer transport system component
MNYKLCLLSVAVLAACNPSDKAPNNGGDNAQPLSIELPAETELHENRTYTFSPDNSGQFTNISWSQTSGTDYGWSQDDQGMVSITLPELPIGTEETLTFEVKVTSADGRTAQSEHSVTVKSNDYLLYISENTETGAERLYILDAESGESTALTLPGTDNTRIDGFAASPDGEFIAVRANLDDDNQTELYITGMDGGELTKVNVPLEIEGGDVVSFEWTDDSASLIYRVDNQVESQYQLYRVTLADLTQQKLSGTLTDGGYASSFQIAPTGDAVLFTADAELDNVFELYVSDIETGVRTKLSQTLTADGDVFSPLWSPNGQGVVYRADAALNSEFNLYYVNRDGSGFRKLNADLVVNGDVSSGYRWLPDGTRVVFKADDAVDGDYNLYASAIDGSSLVQINDDLIEGGDVLSWKLNTSGTHVAFNGDVQIDGVTEMFVAQVDGGNRTRLNNAFVEGGDVKEFDWVSDAGPIVFIADGDLDERAELYAANVNGTHRRKISDPIGNFENAEMDVGDFIVAPDGSYVIYHADQYIDERHTLFQVDFSNDMVYNTLTGVTSQAELEDYGIRRDSNEVFARVTMVNTTTNLVVASPEGGDVATLNKTTKDDGVVNVVHAVWSPDNSAMVYLANETDDYNELYLVDIETQSAVRVDDLDTSLMTVNYIKWVE